MKLLIYVVGGFVAPAGALMLIARGETPASSPAILAAIICLFAVPPFGAFWMIYMSIRHEKNPFAMLLLALIPFTFVWYYFERVRKGKLLR